MRVMLAVSVPYFARPPNGSQKALLGRLRSALRSCAETASSVVAHGARSVSSNDQRQGELRKIFVGVLSYK